MKKTKNSYKKSGVNIELANRFVKHIAKVSKKNVKNMNSASNKDNIGAFGSIFDISNIKIKDPLIVSCTDGVGTKLDLANRFKIFDTIGIGLYTMVGISHGLQSGLPPVMCIALGTITACFGGVIRDILCNEIPVIFRKEIYATACIMGGIGFFLLRKLPYDDAYAYVATILIVIGIRLLAVKFKISLPSIYRSPKEG